MKPVDIRSEFAVYDENPDLGYFDSASTTLVPKQAVRRTWKFLSSVVVSSRKGAYKLAIEGSKIVEDTRSQLAEYLGTNSSQVSFQKSLPSAVASFVYGFDWGREKRNKIVIGKSEENSITASLLRAAEVLKLETEMIPTDSNGVLNLENIDKLIDDNTGIVAVGHIAPGLGLANPIEEISKVAHDAGAALLTDATRSAGFTDSSIIKLGSDILLFSANIGLMGPPGLALQWMRSDLSEGHRPGILGGSSISNLQEYNYDVSLPPNKFESDVLNVPAIAGLSSSLTFIQSNHNLIHSHLKRLSRHMLKLLEGIENLHLYGSPSEKNTIFGFNLGSARNLSSHDVALFLDESNIAVRSGLICAPSLIQSIAGDGLIQASIHAYNTTTDINRLGNVLETILRDLV
ncbi:aminotransferase class V-fold PLP-dependent enzyme [Candidatus Thorarchaeota archaeon]|nr:MAG: aminotransferase class V-fold PLP-dependent enzyme [Candidatus Thorarchaeota archaeon]